MLTKPLQPFLRFYFTPIYNKPNRIYQVSTLLEILDEWENEWEEWGELADEWEVSTLLEILGGHAAA